MREELRRLIRWGIKSVGGLVANLALLTLWVDVVGFAAWWAVGLNWLSISIAGYVVTDRWVFGELANITGLIAHCRQWAEMQAVMAGGKAVNYVIYLVLLDIVDYRLAWAIGAVLTFMLTFAGNRWVFGGQSIPTSG